MNKPVVEVHIRAIVATSGGYAVFLGNEEKVFVILVDPTVGAAITMNKAEFSFGIWCSIEQLARYSAKRNRAQFCGAPSDYMIKSG
jgi:hypothetical protein